MPLDHRTTLPDGTRVRIRLPRHGDGAGLHALAQRLGVAADEVELRRALRFDPRKRVVIVATSLGDGPPELVGWAAMDRDADEPDTLLADVTNAPGLGQVLASALVAHASKTRAA